MPQWLLQLLLPDSYGGAGQGRLASTACRTGGGQWTTGTGCSCDWAASRWTAWLGPGPPLALAAHTTGRLAAALAVFLAWRGWTYCVLAICWRMCGVTAVLQLRLVVVCAVSAGRRGRATSCRAGQAGWLGGLRPTAGHPRPRGFTLPTLRLHTGRGPSPGPPSAPRQPLASLVVVPAAPVHCHRGAGAGRAVRGTGLRDTGHLALVVDT